MLWNANYSFQQFVNEIGKMIKYDVNLIDKDGRIIASTDHSRIGHTHEAALIIIEKGLDKLAIDDNNSYKGTKRGINLPVMLENELVGVVGITGDPNKVEEYGEIIRKVTQMMLQEERDKQRERISHTIYKNLICEWLMKVPRDYNDFISRAKLLGIEVEMERRCIIFQLAGTASNESFGKQLLKANDLLESSVQFAIMNWHHGVYLCQESRCIVLLPDDGGKNFMSFCLGIKENVETNSKIRLAVGVGSVGKHIDEMQRSFSEAEQAVSISMRELACDVRLYEEMDVETLFQTIPGDEKTAYIRRVMGKMPPNKFPRYMTVLHEMYQLNGSITQVAAKMFVHKNTLQQWILKIKEYTGYDPRIIREGVPLYIAMLFYREIEGEMNSFRDNIY